jgi:hypothetical protein
MEGTYRKRFIKMLPILIGALAMSILLASCLPGDGKATVVKPAGFFWGVWHGWMAPISLIAGIFNKSIRVYEKFNSGWWYDLGFYLAIVGGFGGLALSRKGRRRG